MILDLEALQNATKNKNMRIYKMVQVMRVRQKRHLFYILRHVPNITTDVFLPQFGLHCGEFATYQILSEYQRKDSKKEQDTELLSNIHKV